ncbi:MAG: FlgD immunoglobulin-like domain containing protein, partial [Acidobacteriota bacterium]|nr:FlgD immunoglobulin-like domain containing protein [Acidobacteriota bacterium]
VWLRFSGTRVLHFQGDVITQVQSSERTVTVGEPFSLEIELRVSGSGTVRTASLAPPECDVTMANVLADYSVSFAGGTAGAPTGGGAVLAGAGGATTVFNLPPGYTANSADGSIVDNMYVPETVSSESTRRDRKLRLLPPAPNPFVASATVSFDMPSRARTKLAVYDLRGSQVRRLVDEIRAAGRHTVTWDGRDDRGIRAPSGIYFLRLEVDSHLRSRKVLLGSR